VCKGGAYTELILIERHAKRACTMRGDASKGMEAVRVKTTQESGDKHKRMKTMPRE
jgi:hypothetical protein